MARDYGLGRIPSKPHPRMAAFRAAEILPTAKPPRSYTWRCDTYLDQGTTSRCVGFSAAHEAAARPAVHRVDEAMADQMYRYAQDHDYWPGNDYEGSSVDGGMQALRERGLIKSWWWCDSVEDALLALGYTGPIVLGISWSSGMFTPDQDGFIAPTGADAGGHAILATQVRLRWKPGTTTAQKLEPSWHQHLDPGESWVGLHNSWGRSWQPQRAGGPIPARLRLPDFRQLLASGEAAVPSQRVPAPRAAGTP